MPANKYLLEDGTRVPGCTTICGQLDKPALLDWVARITKEGKDWREERDSAGDIGTLVHELIMQFISGEEVTLAKQKRETKKCFNKFLGWWAKETKQDIVVELMEHPLVSECFKFGGAIDLYAQVNEKHDLIDFKTGKAIYETHILQVVAYKHLLEENGYPVDRIRIVRFGKDNTETEEQIVIDFETGWQAFLHLLGIYYLRPHLLTLGLQDKSMV